MRKRTLVVPCALLIAGGFACSSASTALGPTTTPESSRPANGASWTTWAAGYRGYSSAQPPGSFPSGSIRILDLPKVPDGTPCPLVRARRVTHGFGLGLGEGPVFAAAGTRSGVIRVAFPPGPQSGFAGSGWSAAKVLWIDAPSYPGPLLIRGEQVNGWHPMGFTGSGSSPLMDLQLGPAAIPGSWRSWPSSIRLEAPGCYGVQVDGTTFSEDFYVHVVAANN